MKHFIMLAGFITTIAISTALQSCKKEQVYSCNEDLNNYAAMTSTVHQEISRNDLAKMGLDTQFAIINSLSPENNARILKEKIAILLADATVEDADKIHLQKLADYVTGDLYTNPEPEQDPFLKSWRDHAYHTLHWNEDKMQIYLHTWMTQNEFMHAPDFSGEGGAGSDRLNCNCDGGYLCETILGKQCRSISCNRTSLGCGFAWLNPCNGRCSL